MSTTIDKTKVDKVKDAILDKIAETLDTNAPDAYVDIEKLTGAYRLLADARVL